MRVALVYDCLYPHSIGGAERWARRLAEELAGDHEVTYVTRRQWPRGSRPAAAGVECVAVSPRGRLYTRAGRRRLMPPLLFGAGVFLHFVRRRRAYDVVHCLSYPYSGLIAVRAALAGSRVTVYCEWLECLSDAWWRSYAGVVGGRAGALIQGICVRLTPTAFAFSDLVATRLRERGFRGVIHRLPGLGPESASSVAPPAEIEDAAPLVLFAGRHVEDKGVAALPEALSRALRRRRLRAVLVGDGPERERVLALLGELGLEQAVRAPGFLEASALEELRRHAACAVSPSVRDGYGMAVLESIATGTPTVVCRHPDNAAVELVEEGTNGAVAESASAADIADAIVRVLDGGERLRASTAAWARANCSGRSMERSIAEVRAIYAAQQA